MNVNHDATQRWRMNCVHLLVGGALALFAGGVQAQTTDLKAANAKPAETYQAIFLANITQPSDANDIVNALRNVLPKTSVYWVSSQGALAIRADADEMQIAQKMISDLDRPRRSYRVTYTISEIDGGKRVGSQAFTLIVVPGRKAYLKQGTKVPILTGTPETKAADKGSSAQSSQVTYVDVGLNIEASVDGYADGTRLHSKVEQSSIADEKSGVGVEDPVIRQASLEGTTTLAQGKPALVGSLDLPGGTRHQEIEVIAEAVR